MRVRSAACIGIGIGFLVCAAAPARAQMQVGPNLEWNYWSNFPKSSFIKSGSSIAVGGYYLSPGLRLGYLFPGAAFTATADVGIQHESLEDIKYTNVLIEGGLAYAFLSERTTSPYVGVCAGWHDLSEGSSLDISRPLVGGSAGVRHRVAAGHGFVRAEVRYDHFTTAETKGFILPQDMVGLRIGADLLLSK